MLTLLIIQGSKSGKKENLQSFYMLGKVKQKSQSGADVGGKKGGNPAVS